MTVQVLHGDCLEVLRGLEDCSVDAIVTDPPYGLSNTKPAQVADVLKAWVTGDTKVVPAGKGFMGKDWDGFVPPPAVWEECMRVLKPGGHMAVFAGARTQDLMGLSIRLAGFEIREGMGWIFGSGFPKSHDIGKAIDKRPGVHHHREFAAHLKEKREAAGLSRQDVSERVVGTRSGACWNWEHHQFPRYEWWPALRDLLGLDEDRWGRIVAEADRDVVRVERRFNEPSGIVNIGQGERVEIERKITAPATSEAARWEGWGTALKPAIEPIILARKPLDGTVAANVLAHGVGGLNIDACRVPGTKPDTTRGASVNASSMTGPLGGQGRITDDGKGRFPANVLLDEHAAEALDQQSGNTKSTQSNRGNGSGMILRGGCTSADELRKLASLGFKTPNGETATKVLERYEKTLNDDFTRGHNDSGGASRFFPVFKSEEETPETKGRFPANVLLDEHAAQEMDKQSGVLKSGAWSGVRNNPKFSGATYNGGNQYQGGKERGTTGDSGGASRFFPVFKYQAKAPKKERPTITRDNGTKIQHPTVKPVALMEWLVTLITPPGGVVLDPFAGSGTTLQAAINKGFQPIGIEQDADYIQLINKRLGVTPSTLNN